MQTSHRCVRYVASIVLLAVFSCGWVLLDTGTVSVVSGAALMWFLAASASFALGRPEHVTMMAFWAAALLVGLPLMVALAAVPSLPNIFLRKARNNDVCVSMYEVNDQWSTQGYHVLALWLFVPAMLCTPQLLAVGLAAATALFTLLELARVLHVPLLGPAVARFVQSFTDARDSGRILISHFSLLLGIAVPIWLTAAAHSQHGQCTDKVNPLLQPPWVHRRPTGLLCMPLPFEELWQVLAPWPAHALGDAVARSVVAVPAFAGMLCLGVCDSVACVVGRSLGRWPVHVGAKKTVEGLIAGALVTAGLLLLLLAGGVASGGLRSSSVLLTCSDVLFATGVTALLEAVTLQLDNIALPLHCYALLSCIVASLQL